MFFKAQKNENGHMGPQDLLLFMESVNKRIDFTKAEKMIDV